MLAGLAGYGLFAPRGAANAEAAMAAARAPSLPQHLRRPLRVSAEAAGVSRPDLVDRIVHARSVRDVQLLADRLGAVGDDHTVDQLAPLLADPRRGVPEAILACYGRIGSAHAVEVLIERADDDRPQVRVAAIAALGSTQSEQAEQLLVDLAQRSADPAQAAAISALGSLASDAAVTALIELGRSGDYTVASAAVTALGSVTSEAAVAALRSLIDAPDVRVAAAALTSIETVDTALLGRLTAIVKGGESQLVVAALTALARAGDAGLPVLRTAASSGNQLNRNLAVNAIGQIGTLAAIRTLGELLNTAPPSVAQAAASALASLGGREARELLINAALGDRAKITGAVSQLAALSGDDVDQALLAVMASGSSADRRAALPRLLKAGHPEALALANQLARSGGRTDKVDAMRMLAESGAPKAFEVLVDVAGASRGQTRGLALEMIAQSRPGDPAFNQLLRDSLLSGRGEEAHYAATILGNIGTPAARDALVLALSSKEAGVASMAAMSLGQAGMTDAVRTALLSAAQSNPTVKQQVMHQLLQVDDPAGMRLAEELLGGDGAPSAISALMANPSAAARRLLDHAIEAGTPEVRAAALSSLAQSPDEQSTETLVRLARDRDAGVRAAALSTLGQIGSDRARSTILEATRSGAAEDRVAAISGLGTFEDPASSAQLARLMRDPDPLIIQAAIGASYNGGPEVDHALTSILTDANADASLKVSAADQLRLRGSSLDDATEALVTTIVGPAYGGAGYGGGGYGGIIYRRPR